jgi:hypothetical protein
MCHSPCVSLVCITLTCGPVVYVTAHSIFIVMARHCIPTIERFSNKSSMLYNVVMVGEGQVVFFDAVLEKEPI